MSGYLPITKAAYEKTKASGFYEKNPILEVPLKELTNKPPTENSRGLRFGGMVQMRDVWSEEIEAALAGKKSAKEALDAAVARGNQMLRQFERTADASERMTRLRRQAMTVGRKLRPRSAAPIRLVPQRGARMENRAIFSGRLLPYLLILPQLAISLVFSTGRRSQALWQSFLVQDAFGLSTEFVWFENYLDLLQDPGYYQAIGVTFVFSALVAASRSASACCSR